MQAYTVLLAYAWSETKYGTTHSFGLFDPDNKADSLDDFCEDLENELRDRPDEDVNSNYLSVALPETLVKRIQEDAIQTYLKRENTKKEISK